LDFVKGIVGRRFRPEIYTQYLNRMTGDSFTASVDDSASIDTPPGYYRKKVTWRSPGGKVFWLDILTPLDPDNEEDELKFTVTSGAYKGYSKGETKQFEARGIRWMGEPSKIFPKSWEV